MHWELEDVTIFTQTNREKPIRIVASVNRDDKGVVFDWAAYIGCGTIGEVREDGEKMLDRWAAAFFPHLPVDSYRD